MTQGLPISRLISVSVNLSPTAVPTENFDTLMIMGDSNVIDVSERYRAYNDLTAVALDFGTNAPEYLAAALYFGQNPQPAVLYIGRWAFTATHGLLHGGPLTSAQRLIANFAGITTGAFGITIDGIPYSINGLDFSAASNLNGVATDVQTALNSVDAGTTCAYDGVFERFSIVSPTTGLLSSVTNVRGPTATGNINFGVTNPSNLDTITINGTVVTFVVGTPVGVQVKIGASLAATLTALLVFLQASADVQLVKFTYAVTTTKLYLASVATGTSGNALTIAASVATPSGGTLSGGSGVDVSTLLKLTTAAGATSVGGIAAESALASVIIMDTQAVFWYGLDFDCPDITDNDRLAIAAYIEGDGTPHVYGITTAESAAITTNDTTSIGYQLKQLGYDRSFCQYSSTNAYAVASFFGRAMTVDFTANNSVITMMYQTEPGVIPEALNSTQANALDANNYNYFAAFNINASIIVNGTMASGVFFDTIFGTDWLANDIQTAVFNLLYGAKTKIPQTDAGNNTIATTITASLQQGVNNGLLAPGTWNAPGFGQIVQGQFLPLGYYVYTPPIASQNQANRAGRKSVHFQVAAKGAGAIQSVDVAINFNA